MDFVEINFYFFVELDLKNFVDFFTLDFCFYYHKNHKANEYKKPNFT